MPAPPPPLPVTISRGEFLDRRWTYQAGEHVTILGPTQAGKTTLAFELLGRTASRQLPAVVLVMKPRDGVVTRHINRLGLRRVRSWPPPLQRFKAQPPGWALWPKHTYDPQRDDETLYVEFRKAIIDSYKRGNRIIFADELLGLTQELRLQDELRAIWTRGASLGCGLWGATQRPAMIPQYAYNCAEHLFLSYEPDARNRMRLDEIGGVDAGLVRHAVQNLRRYQWLYVRRTGPAMCIIDRE